MKLEKVSNLSAESRLVYWIKERESIRVLKESGKPPPWTDDLVLQSYRFCNVRRMDDKVSRWLLENWYTPYFNCRLSLVMCCVARHFNLPRTLTTIQGTGFPEIWHSGRIKQMIRKLRDTGVSVFNNAYMVRGKIQGSPDVDKIETVIDRVCAPLIDNPPPLNNGSMRESVEALTARYGLGSFMAGQIVADLRWCSEGEWADRNEWAPIGPGSMRGMNRLHGRPYKLIFGQDQFMEELGGVMKMCKRRVYPSLTDRLEAIDYQNCLCEFDKYTRALLGEGRPKNLYNGHAVGE